MQLVRYNLFFFFALLISMPRINSINFYQNRPKINLYLPEKTRALGYPPPLLRWLGSCSQTPIARGGWGSAPRPPHCDAQ